MACMLTVVYRKQAVAVLCHAQKSASLRLVGKVGASLLIQVGMS
jgi:hypothetical protein